jgi:hypothetical protein
MKRIVFLISHVGSDSDKLLKILNENPRVQILNGVQSYRHPVDLDHLISKTHHKLDNTAAVYGDHLLYNTQFNCEAIHSICKFIYVVREAKPSLNEDQVHLRQTVESYYRFRLRRIYEMAKRTPGSVLLTWDDMQSGAAFPLLEDYLGLKEPLAGTELFIKSVNDRVPFQVVEHAQDAYEKYLYKLKNLDLLLPK